MKKQVLRFAQDDKAGVGDDKCDVETELPRSG